MSLSYVFYVVLLAWGVFGFFLLLVGCYYGIGNWFSNDDTED